MNSIQVEDNTVHTGVADFQGEAFAPSPVLRTLPQFEKVTDDNLADVRKILARPKFLKKHTFDNFDYYTFVNLDNKFYRDMFNLSERFAGAFGIRFTTCFRLVVAAAPQVGGLLRVYYNPVGVEGVNGIINTYKDNQFWTSLSPTAYSQMPGAELNLESATAIDYKIPYTHFLDFMPLDRTNQVENNMSLGTYNLVSYLPVHYEAGTTVPEYSLYVWLEDIEIIGARNPELNALIFSQSGKMRSGVEEDVERDGPLSGPLYKLGKAASLVGGAIPLLSSVTQPLGWATRIASNMAAAFGYSRPLQLEQSKRMVVTQNHYQNNADGPDASFNLGLLQDNKICLSDNAGGTNVDEMALSFLTQKPAAVTVFKVNTGDTGRRYHLVLCPRSMYEGGLGNTAPFVHAPNQWINAGNAPLGFKPYEDNVPYTPTPLFWLSTMFKAYRGGFKIKIKTNKTRFHGGRIMVGFTPFAPLDPDLEVTLAPRSTGAEFGGTDLLGISKIWDIRESSEIEFECPYTAITPYLEVQQPFGAFTFCVCDAITAPDTVQQFLDFVVEVSGMDDFEFAMPQQEPYIVDPLTDYRRLLDSNNNPISAIVSQSGEMHHTEHACECIGEKVLSVKQLISRSEWTLVQLWNRFTEGLVNGKQGYALPTWFESYVACVDNYGGNPPFVQAVYKVSTIDLITAAYAFARGSTCYDLVSSGEKPTLFTLEPSSTPRTGLIGTGSQLWEKWKYNKAKAPYYANTKKLPTLPATDTIKPLDPAIDDFPAFAYTKIKMRTRVFAAPNDLVSRRAGDDAQLSFFICAPRVRYMGAGTVKTRYGMESLGSVDGVALESTF